MHEIALVKNIFTELEAVYPHKMHLIQRIQLKAGVLSNVQPILMQNAFSAVIQEESKYAHIELEVLVIPIKIQCESCHLISEVQQYRFICSCGKPCRNIIEGEELLISEVEFISVD
ncbi:MAG: hydrogenase maturation nickel metallochaperone HypA [Ferruginibacter sp.]